MLDDGKFMSSIEFVNFMARSGLRTWTWMTRCRSTNEAKFIPMQPNVVGLVAGRGGENLKRLKQLPDVDSIEVYTNDADGQFEGRIHKQAGAHDRKWIIMEVKVGRLRVFHVRYSASFRVEMYIQYVWRHGSIFYRPVCLFSDVRAGLVVIATPGAFQRVEREVRKIEHRLWV